MQIRFGPLLYIVSFAFSISQTVYAGLQLYFFLKKEKSGKSIFSSQRIVLFFMFIGLFVFNVNNLLGMIVSYTQVDVKYRAYNPNGLEKAVEFTDLIFETFEASTGFLSILLFQPIFSNINSSSPKESSHFFYNTILIFSIFRLFIYPTVFLIFKNHPNLILYIIDILNIGEYFLLIFLFIHILLKFRRITNENSITNQYRKIIFESQIVDLKTILIILFTQMIIDIFYKAVVLTVSLMPFNFAGYIILDYSYLLRLISLSLQLYSVFKLCFMGIGSNFDDVKEKHKSINNKEEECIGPKNMLYFTQPNDDKIDQFTTY